jgi:hypothetical protein
LNQYKSQLIAGAKEESWAILNLAARKKKSGGAVGLRRLEYQGRGYLV